MLAAHGQWIHPASECSAIGSGFVRLGFDSRFVMVWTRAGATLQSIQSQTFNDQATETNLDNSLIPHQFQDSPSCIPQSPSNEQA